MYFLIFTSIHYKKTTIFRYHNVRIIYWATFILNLASFLYNSGRASHWFVNRHSVKKFVRSNNKIFKEIDQNGEEKNFKRCFRTQRWLQSHSGLTCAIVNEEISELSSIKALCLRPIFFDYKLSNSIRETKKEINLSFFFYPKYIY